MSDTKQRFPRYPTNAAKPSRRWRRLSQVVIAVASLYAVDAAAEPLPSAKSSQRHHATSAWQMPTATSMDASPGASANRGSVATGSVATSNVGTRNVGYMPTQPVSPAVPRSYDAAEAADEPTDEEDGPPNFDLMVGTQVPLSVGLLGGLELPGRILLFGEVGWMPRAYGSAINGVVQGLGGYDDSIRQLIDGSLEDGLVVRLSGGWRPFPSAGFEIFGGYTHIALSGSVDPSAVAAIAGAEFASQAVGQLLAEDVLISSALHNFHVGLGWRWVAFDHLVIRASLSYTQTLASSSAIETPAIPEAGLVATPLVDATLQRIYQDYSKLPLVGLSAGYRF